MTHWGKAGERLSTDEARRRAARIASRRQAQLRAAKLRWAAGKVVPHYITLALDAHELYGPEVDRACGVEEPGVDLWEAGLLYPTWDQLVALAELTGCTPGYFVRDPHGINPARTSLRYHVQDAAVEPPPIMYFTQRALDAARLTEVRL